MNGKFWKFYDDREDDYLLAIDDEEKQSDREVNVNQGFGSEFRESDENAAGERHDGGFLVVNFVWDASATIPSAAWTASRTCFGGVGLKCYKKLQHKLIMMVQGFIL